MGMRVKTLNLHPGQQKIVGVPFSLPFGLSPGTYTYLASVSGKGASITATGPELTVVQPVVALTASRLQPVTGQAAPGKSAELELSISNTGNQTVSGSPILKVSVYSSGSSADSAIELAMVRLRVQLKPGASRLYKVRITLPTTLTGGSYFLSTSLGVDALGDTNPSDGTAVSGSTISVT